jgi:hypothetical protein
MMLGECLTGLNHDTRDNGCGIVFSCLIVKISTCVGLGPVKNFRIALLMVEDKLTSRNSAFDQRPHSSDLTR